jgi:hypothetical protein
MKPVTYDFDVITDAPAPRRRLPDAAAPTPHAEAEGERRQAAPPEGDERGKVRAAE